METMGATVEGGVAGRLGDWSLGVAAGVRARDTRSIAAVVRRVRRHTEPGVAVGIARELSGSAVRVGLHGSVLREATTIVLHPLAAPTRVLRLRGFAEPIPNDIIGQYFHRLSRTQRTVGAAAAGGGGDLQWVAAVEVGSLDEGQFHEARNDPARQRWKSDVVRTSVRVGTPVRGAGWVQVGAARASLDGRAHRPDIESTTFSSRDRDWEAEGLVRIPVATHWWWTGEGTVHRINRHQRDHDLRVSASLEAWNTSIGMGLTFEPREGLWIGAAHKWTRYVPAGRVPLPSSVGELTRAFVLPQYILHATEARVHSTVLRIDYATGSRGTLSASLNRGTSSPTEATATAFALTPEGRRDDWEVRFAWSPAR